MQLKRFVLRLKVGTTISKQAVFLLKKLGNVLAAPSPKV